MIALVNSPLAASVILAARSGRDTSDLIVTLIIILGLATAAGWVSWQRLQKYRGRGIHHPRQLFVILCRAHSLDRSQQRLLYDLAQARQLQHPGLVFLQPDLFDPAKLGPQFEPHRKALLALRQQLFAAEPLAAKFAQSSQTIK